MSCNGVEQDTYDVIVKIPKPLRTRCKETWVSCRPGCLCAWSCFLFFSVGFVVYGLVWVLSYCQGAPGLGLETLTIRDMTVYQNSTGNTTSDSPWQVNSNFNVTLSTWNTNTVARCFTTYRQMFVTVLFKNNIILQQEIPLSFSLKPRRSRPVFLQLKGEYFNLKKDLGPVMEAKLQSKSITLEIFVDTRFLRNDRRSGWVRMGCLIVAKTPSNFSQLDTGNSLLSQQCFGI